MFDEDSLVNTSLPTTGAWILRDKETVGMNGKPLIIIVSATEPDEDSFQEPCCWLDPTTSPLELKFLMDGEWVGGEE